MILTMAVILIFAALSALVMMFLLYWRIFALIQVLTDHVRV